MKIVNSELYCLSARKNIFTQEIRKLLVTATIILIIDYCSMVSVDTDLKLARAVNSAIRNIFSLKQDESITLY